ncbi:hypothetical protein [Chelatococcus asaccharovorans]|uniref:hypothetical protein n=1 Tax=Chelatococcus asaccharovorans TaxID=28210 RepID=UPI002263E60E|nr:hypothetical protein [Chelatococcus asaccharovorans]
MHATSLSTPISLHVHAVCEITVPSIHRMLSLGTSSDLRWHVRVTLPWISILAVDPPHPTDRRYQRIPR